MNIRSLRTAAVAGLMMLGSSAKVAAQSVEGMKNAAEKVVVSDTVKSVKGNVRDAKTILLKKYHGHFDGSVKNGKIADGSLQYTEKGKTLLPNSSNGKVEIALDARYVNGKDLVNNGFGVHGSAKSKNDLFDVTGIVAQKEPCTDFVAKGSYTRLFPINDNVAVTAKAEAEGVIKRVLGHDSYGIAWPQAAAGVRYEQKFDNGLFVGAKGEAGIAASIVSKEHVPHDIPKTSFVANGEIEAGANKVSAFVNGGKDPVLGNNIGVGVRYRLGNK